MSELGPNAETSLEQTLHLAGQEGLSGLSEQYLQVVEQAPIAISISDLDANFLYVNQCFTEVTGYSSAEVIGKKHSLLSFKTTPHGVYQGLWEAISAGENWQGTLINRKKSGQRYLAEVSIKGLYNKAGEITHYVGMHRDISRRHNNQTKVANQKAMVEAVLNTAPVAIALIDDSQTVVLDNLSYKTLASDFQREPVDLVAEQFKPGENEAGVAFMQLADGQQFNLEVGNGGHKRWFSCCLSAVQLNDGNVDDYFTPTTSRYLVLTLSEFTREQRRQQQQRLIELQRSTAESEALHSMQEALHAAIHQIQGPINMIDSALTMFCGGANRCSRIDAMQAGLNAGNAAIVQLQNALPQKPYEAMQSVNINQLVHEVTEMSNQRLLSRSIAIQLNLNGTLPAFTGQPSRIRVALKQLLDNAIEAIDFAKMKRRDIVFSTQVIEGDIEISVEDSGPGIDKKLQLKVFEPFYSTKPLGSSSCRGVGLSIVQQVVSDHSGTVQYQATSLGGCKAKVVLPLRSNKRGE
ncbi:nitrogen fixation negative regulator NifL [Agarivorans sp. TSD2052]|uniref:nitrogen fixation negative regulator NifL n=1 Tax=Agarivorans sp. TSD2052 TaxID=2937286 RepID=UPI00200F553A|nr:nitrogen fixation negative regulator NifL [Agarivorans sp. TSD2052]UPW20365.1 nitrogen fixation negative regulator NifL [Agarivorans sp. TSD2052]